MCENWRQRVIYISNAAAISFAMVSERQYETQGSVMDSFDQLWVWSDAAMASSLGWYRAVAANRKPAKFRIASTIPVAVPLRESPEAVLWDASLQKMNDPSGRAVSSVHQDAY